jgi:hypothetical protein
MLMRCAASLCHEANLTSSGQGHLARLRSDRRAKRQGQGQSRRAAAARQREEQAHLCAVRIRLLRKIAVRFSSAPTKCLNRVFLRLEGLPSKLRGVVRNAKTAEAEITALKISYLKRIGKGSNVIVMDSSVPGAAISFPIASSSAFR